ncbi:MAG: hypothetical protein DRP18_00205 [Candidatus Aenigmatarchaeota archaeon]|nr:MAG: hypothetical protein DRP18_00205 [Candidatus Aenigmarchaeota archaeon]
MRRLGYYLNRKVRDYITREIKKRGKIIVSKSTLEWLLDLLTHETIDINRYMNDCILNDYKLNLIKPTDVVLDIGAGAGLYSLLASLVARKVYALEPILEPIYALNNPRIEILPYAFGKNEKIKCNYWGKEVIREGKSLTQILEEIPDITVIKCDCEGCEWDGFSGCNDFKSIRLLDIEYHLSNSIKPLKELERRLRANKFSISTKSSGRVGMLYAKK